MKKISNAIIGLVALINFSINAVSAQTLECETGEYFWGISSCYGRFMPIGIWSHNFGLSDSISWNLSSPIMVSNKGKCIVSDWPINVISDSSHLSLDCEKKLSKVGNNLRQAYILAVSKQFKPLGTSPSEEMFALPSYNTWAGLGTSLSQSSVEQYANEIIKSSLKPGVIIINNGWQNYNGSFDFNFQRFNDPKKLIEELHSKGFKVMLEIMPFVSLDCLDFFDFKNSGMLECDKNGSVRIVSWYGGYSAVLNLSSEKALVYIRESLESLKAKYGVDGFKFDYMSSLVYNSNEEYLSRIRPWTDLALNYKYNQIQGAFKYKNFSSLIGQLDYKKQNWESIKHNIAEAINAGLCSFPYIIADPIGGGFADRVSEPDCNLIVRQAQLQAFFPFMNFSMALWKILPKDLFQAVVQAQILHEKMLPYIQELAKTASTTGEPIIRSMEYTFPGKGFYDCNDQFMLGNRYLVSPVYSADNIRTVRLPAGVWIDDNGKRYKGPAVVKVKVPIDRVLYFKASKDIKQK